MVFETWDTQPLPHLSSAWVGMFDSDMDALASASHPVTRNAQLELKFYPKG